MAKKIIRRLVIDTDIASAAGVTEHPISKQSNDFLQTILTATYHELITTPEIREEWNSHMSLTTKDWFVSMIAKKRVHLLDSCENLTLRTAIAAFSLVDGRNAMLKDCILIEAALETDKIIVSMDEKARKHFNKAALTKIGALKVIAWVNPTLEAESCLDWLKAGAKAEKSRKLGQNL